MAHLLRPRAEPGRLGPDDPGRTAANPGAGAQGAGCGDRYPLRRAAGRKGTYMILCFSRREKHNIIYVPSISPPSPVRVAVSKVSGRDVPDTSASSRKN